MVARRGLVAGLLGVLRDRFALFRQRLESRADIDQPLHLLAQLRHVRHDGGPAGANGDAGVALIPIDAVGLDDVVENPALFVEALDHGLALRIAVRPVACAQRRRQARLRRGLGNDGVGDRGAGGRRNRAGLQERTTIHDVAPGLLLRRTISYCVRCAASVTIL